MRSYADGDASPTRKYIDDFLYEQIPHLVVGKKSILEIGCGSGYLRDVLARAGFTGRYVGLDARAYWDTEKTYPFACEVVHTPFETFVTEERFDLICSITVLEHIVDDEAVTRKSKALLAPGGVEFHIMPASPSLPLYLLHGYRQYGRARLQRLFRGRSFTVTRLGGFASYLLQFFAVTIPERLTGKKLVRSRLSYSRATAIAARLDRFLPFAATMFAVIVRGDTISQEEAN